MSRLCSRAQQRSIVRTMSSATTTQKRQNRLPASYYRGGTSRAVMFRSQDLPSDRDQWAAIFRGVIGSPDLYGRQLDGMGGGLSSLSKVCVVGPSTIGDSADVDYTFAAIGVKDDTVDYSSNCGNMSSAIGPFAVDAGLVVPKTDNGECVVNIHNTNTGKIIRATFPLVDGEAAASGDFSIAGVAGLGAPVKLDFVEPSGSKTGKLLPTGRVIESCLNGIDVQMTCIDVGNPCVFVEAESLVSPLPDELDPKAIEGDRTLMKKLELIRRYAALKMGLAEGDHDVPGSIPKIAMVWTPRNRPPELGPEAGDLCVRALSVGQPHKAVPVTVALSLAAAAQLPGTVVHRCLRKQAQTGSVVISHPTGLLKVDAEYDGNGNLESAAVYRTARRLMEGIIFWKQ